MKIRGEGWLSLLIYTHFLYTYTTSCILFNQTMHHLLSPCCVSIPAVACHVSILARVPQARSFSTTAVKAPQLPILAAPFAFAIFAFFEPAFGFRAQSGQCRSAHAETRNCRLCL